MKDFNNHLEYNQQAFLIALQMIANIIYDNVPATKVVIDMSDETHKSYVVALEVVNRLHIKRRKLRTEFGNLVKRKHIVDERLSCTKESFPHGKTKKFKIVKDNNVHNMNCLLII
jgi:hypothetical protein